MQNDLDIVVNGPTGMVTVTQSRRNGIILPHPVSLDIPIDQFVLTALKVVEHGINERAVPMLTNAANGFKI